MASPIERLVNQLMRMNLRNLSPMQVNQAKKRKRSPTVRRSPGKSAKKTKRG